MSRSPMSRMRERDPFKIGALTLVAILILLYFGFTKNNPLSQPFQFKAAFKTVNALREKSPVRVAGVNVGKVTGIETLEGGRGAIVTMEIAKEGLPVHDDARLKIRPRIFLEGNYFVDLEPGSPSLPAIDEGHVVPVQQTSAPVQLGQVLTALQSDTREDVRKILDEYGRALAGGADGFNRSVDYWHGAFKGTAIVNEATLGLVEHDLSRYIESAGTVARGLDRDPAKLKSLITDFAATADALALAERPLTRAIGELPKTLRAGRGALGRLNEAFPPFRRLIGDMRPAVRASGRALKVAIPFAAQLRRLVGDDELGGLVRQLKPTVPHLVDLQEGGVPLQGEIRKLSACQNNVVLPWSGETIPDDNFEATGPVYVEGAKWLPGISGESRAGDANGQWIRTLAQTANHAYPLNDGRFLLTTLPLQGNNPPAAPMPPLRSDVPCETQQPPDLRSRPGLLPTAIKVDQDSPAAKARWDAALDESVSWLRGQLEAEGLDKKFKVSSQPLTEDALPALRGYSQRIARRLKEAGK